MTRNSSRHTSLAASMRKFAFSLFAVVLGTVFTSESDAGSIPAWKDLEVGNGMVYLLRQSPAIIMRYDLEARQWIESIQLEDIPDVFVVEGEVFYIAYPGEIRRRSTSGDPEFSLAVFSGKATDLMLDGNLLFASRNGRLTVIDAMSGEVLNEWDDNRRSQTGTSMARQQNRIFGRSNTGSPSDIYFAQYDDTGEIVAHGDSPYHGDLPGASATWVYPDDLFVVDSSGTVYKTPDLRYADSLATTFTDIAFTSDGQTIVLSEDTLIRFSSHGVELDRYTLETAPLNIVVYNDEVHAFIDDESEPTEVRVEVVEISEFAPLPLFPQVDPNGLAFEIQSATTDGTGMVFLAGESLTNVFRWDIAEQSYAPSIALNSDGWIVAYSAVMNRLYVANRDRNIFRLDQPQTASEPLAHVNTALQVDKLLPMNQDLFALLDRSWEDQWLFGSEGELLRYQIDCCYTEFYLFDEVFQRIYYDNSRQEYLGEGEFGPVQSFSITGDPIALSPRSQLLLTDLGHVYQAETMNSIAELPDDILAGAWSSNRVLLTVKGGFPLPANTTVQSWNSALDSAQELLLIGEFQRMFMAGDRAVVITSVNGVPSFTVLDESLNIIPPPGLDSPQLGVESFTALAAQLSWPDVQGESEYLIERKLQEETEWTELAVLPHDTTSYVDSSIITGIHYQYRGRAVNGQVLSPYSAIVSLDLTHDEEPGIHPEAVSFVPDDALITDDNVVLLFSREHLSVFRWSADSESWLDTIPLTGSPELISYSADLGGFFLLDANGAVSSANLQAAFPFVFPHAMLPGDGICGLVATEFSVIGCYEPRYRHTHQAIDEVGRLVNEATFRDEMWYAQWSKPRQEFYHFRDNVSPNALYRTLVLPNGGVGVLEGTSPPSQDDLQYPIRLKPDGSRLILGSGLVYDTDELELVGQTPHPIVDATWLQDSLVTLTAQHVNSHTSPGYESTPRISLQDEGLFILPASDNRFVVVTRTDDGDTRLQVFDSTFRPQAMMRSGFE